MSVDTEKSSDTQVETTAQDRTAASNSAPSAAPSLGSIANPRRVRWSVSH